MEEARKSRPIRVLVIDDDAGVRDVVAAILGDEGYDVSMLDHLADAAVRAAIDRIEPNCMSERAVAAGFAAVLCKPFYLEDLVSTVERVVAAAQPSDGRPQR